jgi:hypothetical protein
VTSDSLRLLLPPCPSGKAVSSADVMLAKTERGECLNCERLRDDEDGLCLFCRREEN